MTLLQKAARAERVPEVALDTVLEAAEVIAEELGRFSGCLRLPEVNIRRLLPGPKVPQG